jgi:CO dehydrogenase/acetyl-CoA synthase alpha subunit
MGNNKKPSDYPMFAFRTFSVKHKNRLDGLVKDLVRLYRKDADRPIKKKEVIAEALEHGLEAKIKEKSKKS